MPPVSHRQAYTVLLTLRNKKVPSEADMDSVSQSTSTLPAGRRRRRLSLRSKDLGVGEDGQAEPSAVSPQVSHEALG